MEIIEKLAATPLPQIFIIAGIFFLVLSVVNKFGGKLDINPKRQGQAIVIGILLIVLGLVIYVRPFRDTIHEPLPIEACEISVYSVPKHEIIHVRNELCRIHISKGIPSNKDEEEEKKNTRFEVSANNFALVPISEIDLMRDESGGWHLQQSFEFREINPGQKYTIVGKTLELNNLEVDSRTFFIVKE